VFKLFKSLLLRTWLTLQRRPRFALSL
jgi:hypothetical protein